MKILIEIEGGVPTVYCAPDKGIHPVEVHVIDKDNQEVGENSYEELDPTIVPEATINRMVDEARKIDASLSDS